MMTLTWYWILLIIVGYFIMTLLDAIFCYFVLDAESVPSAVMGFCWPVMIPVHLLIVLPIILVSKILERL